MGLENIGGNKTASSYSVVAGNHIGTGSVNSGTVSSLASAIAEMRPGEFFSGEIQEMKGNQVTIVTETGDVVQARLLDAAQFSEGQNVTFYIKENSGSQIVIRPVPEEIQTNQMIMKILQNAGLTVNGKNSELVHQLLENQMPVDKKTIQTFLRHMAENPSAEAGELVKMTKLGLPLTKETVSQFQKYQNGTHTFVNDMKGLLSEIGDMVRSFSSFEKETGVSMQKQLLALILEDEEMPVRQAQETIDNKVLSSLEEQEVQEPVDNKVTLPKEEAQKADTMVLIKENALSENADLQKTAFEPEKTKSMQDGMRDGGSLPEEPVNSEEKPVAKYEMSGQKKDTVLLQDIMTAADRQEFQKLAQKLGMSESMQNEILQGNISAKEVLHFIQQNMTPEWNEEIGNHPAYHKLLKEYLEQQWFFKPEEVASKENVTEYFSRIEHQMEHLSHLLQATESMADSGAGTQSSNIKQNIEFINQINQLMNYVQIPLKLGENKLHSDLYVFANKGRQKENNDAFSALLHLDMEALGTLDIHVKLYRKNTDIQFYVEKEEIAQFILEHAEPLREHLEKAGYTVTVGAKKCVEEKSVIERVMEEQQVVPSALHTYSFNARI